MHSNTRTVLLALVALVGIGTVIILSSSTPKNSPASEISPNRLTAQVAQSTTYNPADVNQDWIIGTDEAGNFRTCWITFCIWPSLGTIVGPDLAGVTRTAWLTTGGRYHYDSTKTYPYTFVPGEGSVTVPTTQTLAGYLPFMNVARSVEMNSNATRAYVATDSYGMVVVDTTNVSAPRVLGATNMPFDGLWINRNGNYAYITGGRKYHSSPGVATTVNGFYIVDLTNETKPVVVGKIENGSSRVYKNLAVSGSHAYVASGGLGVSIINISNPALPAIVATYDTPGFAQSVAISGNYAYVADDSNGVVILNISTPTNPTLVKTVDTPGLAGDVAISGNYLHVADANALKVIDITTPANASIVGTLTVSAFNELTAMGNYVYGSNGTLVIIDVTTPTNPVQRAIIPPANVMDSLTHSSVINGSGTLAFVAERNGGLRILDITNKSAPVSKSTLKEFISGFKIKSVSNRLYLSGTRSYFDPNNRQASISGLYILDSTNPSYPQLLGKLENSSLIFKKFDVSGDYVFMASGGAGVKVINISNPALPAIVATYDTPGFAQSVAISGNYAYVADDSNGVVILNISTPTNPTLVKTVDTPGLASDVAISGNYLHVADANALKVIDITNPANASIVGTLTVSAFNELTAMGNYVYGSIASGVLIIDVTTPSNPIQKSTVPVVIHRTTGSYVHSGGDYVFYTNDSGGTAIANISNKSSPSIVNTIKNIGDAKSISADFTNTPPRLYVADGISGVSVITLD